MAKATYEYEGWRRSSSMLALGTILLIALLMGLSIPLGLAPVHIVLSIGILCVLLVAATRWRGYAKGGTGVFWSALVLTFASAIASLLWPYRIYGLMELWLIAVTPLALFAAKDWYAHSRLAWTVSALYLIFVAFSLVSTVYGYSKTWPAVYQFLYNLKFPIMLLLGFRIGWSQSTDERFFKVVQWLWVFFAVFVVWQLLSPETYYSFAGGGAEGGGGRSQTANPYAQWLPSRMTGPFQHSGVLALFSSFFLVVLFIRILSLKGSVPFAHYLAVAAYFILLVLSGQRQEMAGLIIVLATIVFIYRFNFHVAALLAGGLVAVAGFIVLLMVLGKSHLETLLLEWGLIPSVHAITAARTVFYKDSIMLAHQHFPLGTGLGTYAGAAAQHFDHTLYDALGYGRFWWYRLNEFLVDTYWPNFIAEVGWVGTFSFLLLVLSLICYALYMAWVSQDEFLKRLWTISFAGQAIALVVSATSPLYSDPNFVAIILLFFGIAYAQTLARRRAVDA